MTLERPMSGGCQCGAVRFAVTDLGRASICYCRMCQKAFGGIGGALVVANAFSFTRGTPAYFQSSNQVRRGFCSTCGTPLSFEAPNAVALAIGAFDAPADIAPVLQLSPETRLPWIASLASLPTRTPEETEKRAAYYASIVSHQHPDHDTTDWRAPAGPEHP